MTWTLTTSWPLLLLILIPILWWAQRSSGVDLVRKQLWLLTALRSVIVVLLALSLAQPVLKSFTQDVSVIYLLDVSRSAAPAAIQEAMQWIRRTNESGKPSHARFLAFGSNAAAFATPEAMGKVQIFDGPGPEGAVDRSATNLAGALEAASRNLAPNHLKRVVLLSDGNDNAGNLPSELSLLTSEKVRVFTRQLGVRSNRDVWVENVEIPEFVTADEQFPVEVQLYSQAAMDAEVEIRTPNTTLGKHKVHLDAGVNRIGFETRIAEESGVISLEARVKPETDTFGENNTYNAPLVVEGRPRILYIEGYAPSAKYLAKALTSEGLQVDVIPPAAAPSTASGLDRYDAVILSDVEGKLLSSAQMQAVETYVRDLGGGFILAGGENVYGENGYSKTPVEKALPATFDVSRKKPPTVAMMVVLDNSASMRGQKMEMAKEAAKAPLELLRDVDHYGMNMFAVGPTQWVVPLSSAKDRDDMRRKISATQVSVPTGTDAFDSMREAFDALNKATDEVKALLFLTDGQMTVPRDYRSMTQEMRSSGIRVTTVAVGQGADREFLTDLAMIGKGRSYYLAGATNVPQIFMRETELSMNRALHEEKVNVLVKQNIEAFKGVDLRGAPSLLGYMTTKAKPTADLLLAESIGGDPVLLRWQHGLGKAALFTSDVKDRWAADWISWVGYTKFWSQLVRDTMRRENRALDLHVRREGATAIVSLEAIGKDGRYRSGMPIEARMTGEGNRPPSANVPAIDLPQTAPGYYETRVPAEAVGSYQFRAMVSGETGPSRALPKSYPEEYRFYPPDADKLEAISHATGGIFNPNGPEIFQPNQESVAIPIALWPWFAAPGLVLFLVDLLVRRLRLFERTVKNPHL